VAAPKKALTLYHVWTYTHLHGSLFSTTASIAYLVTFLFYSTETWNPLDFKKSCSMLQNSLGCESHVFLTSARAVTAKLMPVKSAN